MNQTLTKDIRPYQKADESAVVGVWHRAGRAAYTFLPTWQELTLEQAHVVFQQVILPNCKLWVGTQDKRVVAYLAMRNSYIDRLYVDPPEQRKGWGSRLVEHAKALCPTGLELHTHQANYGARALYERHGFVAVRFGISPPPESAPDVEYHWRPEKDEIALYNQRHWERMVKEGCGFTIPWLDLDVAVIRQYANGELEAVPEPLFQMYPANVLADVAGKDVLCLAAGGGQQSAVFGLLGARVTVVDLAEGQLDGDRKAAVHYGYEVTTIHADMRNLSCIGDESFDLVYQGPSMSWVPDVREVYSEVARLLRSEGLYRVDFGNPANHFMEWDGEAYRITKPYSERVYRHEGGAFDFRHYLGEIFNGLLAAGFDIQQVEDHPWSLPDPQAQPGSWAHELAYNVGFAIVAKKKGTACQ